MSPLKQALDFIQSRHSIHLSTLSEQGISETSVAPFVLHNGSVYIYVSELSQHTKNLMFMAQKTDNVTSGLLTADEAQTEQLFARERLALQMSVTEVNKVTEDYNVLLSEFEQRFGEVVLMLKSMPDFHLFKLEPISGSYVRGFGQAFSFKGDLEQGLSQSLQHIKPK